jgi:hypothetical protein
MKLTNEEVLALREFISHQFVTYDNMILIKLIRRIMNYEPEKQPTSYIDGE